MKKSVCLIIGVFCLCTVWGQNLYPIKKGKFYGYEDASGNIVVQPKYSAVGELSNFYSWLNLGGKTKMPLCPIGGKWGVINFKGEEVVPVNYDFVDLCQNDMVAVNVGGTMNEYSIKDGLWGLVDLNTGKTIIEPKYNLIGPMSASNVVWAFKGTGLYKKYSKNVRTRTFETLEHTDLNVLFGGKKTSGGWGLVAINGTELTDFDFDTVYTFYNHCARVCKNGKYGIIDAHGKMLIECEYDDFSDYMNGNLFWAKENDRYKLLSLQGQPVTETTFSKVNVFNEYGVAWVSTDTNYLLIDTTGKFLTDEIYETVQPFYNGVATVKAKNAIGLVNYKGKQIAPTMYSTAPLKFGEIALQFKNNGNIVSYITHYQLGTQWLDSEGNKIALTGRSGLFKLKDKISEALWDF